MAGIEHVVSMEEFHSRKVVRREAGETSSGAPDDVQTRNISIQATILEEKFNMVKEAGANVKTEQHSISTPKIQKVLFLLRDHKDFVKYYEPRVVSLGPIHHGKDKYKLGEKYKLVLTSEFVKDSGRSMEDVYQMIKDEIKVLREFFEEEVTKEYDDDGLAWLLFVDGCAILQFIYCSIEDKFKHLSIKNDTVAFVHEDLFLLENQLPYYLLKCLMSLSKKERELKRSIYFLIKMHLFVPYDLQSCCLNWCCVKLILDFLRKKSIGQQEVGIEEEVSSEEIISEGEEPIHLLDLLRRGLLGKKDGQRKITKWKHRPGWKSYRSVQELRAAGIYLRYSTNNCLRLFDLSFTKFLWLGFFWLPRIIVDDLTRPKFLNLIAYEMCPDFNNDYEVSSYVSFLNSLIKEANDVKELRKAGILYNFLGNDQEVAELFNEIGTDLVPNYEIYGHVRSQIHHFYSATTLIWMVSFVEIYFSQPGTFLAFTGALLALGLTAAQTFYAGIGSPCDDFCNNLSRNLTCKR